MPARKTISEEHKQEILRLYNETYEAVPEFSERFGMAQCTVYAYLVRWMGEEAYAARKHERCSYAIRGENHPNYGKHHTAETRSKIGEKSKGRFYSDVAREKMRQAQLRRPPTSPETRAKLSAALKGQPKPPVSPETRAKQSAAQAGKKRSPTSIAKSAAAHQGVKRSAATREKQSIRAIERLTAGTCKSPWKCTASGTYEASNGTMQPYDSSWELQRMQELDADGYRWAKSHGVSIPYQDGTGATRRYYPDFVVTDPNTGCTWIEEVKGYLSPLDLIKFEAARSYCAERGWGFKVLDHSHFNPKPPTLAAF